MKLSPISPVLGADVHGLDLTVPLDSDAFRDVRQAFLKHGVLVFRNQKRLSVEAQVGFARRFGPLHTHPAAPAETDEASVFVIHAHKDSPIANGNGWHTDVSCDAEPPMATMLQIQQLPEGGGGDTLFASMEAAFASLPAEWRQRLCELTARHESDHVYRGRYADRGVEDSSEYPYADHPVVRTHPDTGRPGIYVNRSFTTRILELDEPESDHLLAWLFEHIERPEFQIRLTWQENDVAIWDNRCLQHFAIWDYWPNERRGHRVSIHGDVPFFDAASANIEDSSIRLSSGTLAPKPGSV